MKKIRQIELSMLPSYGIDDHYEMRLKVIVNGKKEYHVIRLMSQNDFESMFDYLSKGMLHEMKQLVLADEI